METCRPMSAGHGVLCHSEAIIKLWDQSKATGFRFHMCDCKALAEEARAAISTVEANVTFLEKYL